jgi:hypothetical protein
MIPFIRRLQGTRKRIRRSNSVKYYGKIPSISLDAKTAEYLAVLVAAALVAAIAVPIVFFTHRALMPTPSELQQLDDLVRKQVNSPSGVQRLSAPDRIEQEGDAKTGYFTYIVGDTAGSRKLHVDWRIERGQVQIVAIKSL